MKLQVIEGGVLQPGDVLEPVQKDEPTGYRPVPDYDNAMTERVASMDDYRRALANGKRKIVLDSDYTFTQLPVTSGTEDEPLVICSDDPNEQTTVFSSRGIHAPKGLSDVQLYNLKFIGRFDDTGISIIGPAFRLFFQDVHIWNHNFGLNIQGFKAPVYSAVLNRCSIIDNWNENYRYASGFKLAGCSAVLANECIFDRNGSHIDGNQPGGAQGMSHNVYVNEDCADISFVRCISTRSATNAYMLRSGGLLTGCFAADSPIPWVIGSEAKYERENKEPRNRYAIMHVTENLAHNCNRWGADYTNPRFSYIADNAFHRIARHPWRVKTDELAYSTVLENNTLHECGKPELQVIPPSEGNEPGELKDITVDGTLWYEERRGDITNPWDDSYARDDGPRDFELPGDFYNRLRAQRQGNWTDMIGEVKRLWEASA